MWRFTRRALLWMLAIIGGALGSAWGIQDLQLFTDVFGVGGVTVPQEACVRNLRTIQQLVESVVRSGEAIDGSDELPSQPECWSRLARRDPSITKLDCPLIHKPVRVYSQRPLSLPAPPVPYLVNPHIFTRPVDSWKDSDIVAVDSQPGHFSDMRGQGIRCVCLMRWDRTREYAYLNERQQPSLIQQLDDFANGSEGSDQEESWRRYWTAPKLDLSRDYVMFFVHCGVLGVMAMLWFVLLLFHQTTGASD